MSVYFIQRGDAGPIKIGRSKNPKARLAALQIASDQPLHLIALADGHKQAEKELHARFASARLEGEWFSPTEEILAYAAAIPVPPEEVEGYGPDDLEYLIQDCERQWRGNPGGLLSHLASTLPISAFGKIMVIAANPDGEAVRAALAKMAQRGAE